MTVKKAKRGAPPQVLTAALPAGRLPDRAPHRSRLFLSGEFTDWDPDLRQQMGAILYGFEQNLDRLTQLDSDRREEALRKLGLLTGPTFGRDITQLLERQASTDGDDPIASGS
jgi:hypothetical protein